MIQFPPIRRLPFGDMVPRDIIPACAAATLASSEACLARLREALKSIEGRLKMMMNDNLLYLTNKY